MKTIQMTIDERLLKLVDKMSRARPATCAANFDNLQTVPKRNIGARITRLTGRRMKEATAALSFALGFDD
jgi:mRNA-degrading endonuclease toxin of MazEF toxin-antitoxin module